MPLYEYACQSCNTKFDLLVRAADRDAKAKCPHCGSNKASRALSLVSVAADGKGAASDDTPACGRCNEVGGCGM